MVGDDDDDSLREEMLNQGLSESPTSVVLRGHSRKPQTLQRSPAVSVSRDEDRLFRQLTCTCLTIPMSLAFEGWSGGRTSTANASAMIATTRGKLGV